MRVLFIIILLFVFAPAAIAAEDYICPMHPHIHGEMGDTCPICGMNLVPSQPVKKEPEQKAGAFQIDATYRQALGIKTAPVVRREFGKGIAAFGAVMPNMRLQHDIAVRTAGWIVDLKASAVGDVVKKGDMLLTYYSPDLMAAQSDFLIGANRVGHAEQRLRLYGMDDQSIALLKKSGSAMSATPFYAPADGTVSLLNVRKGAYMEEGDTLLTLQDYTEIWIEASLPVRDLRFLSAGTPATVIIPETGDIFHAAADLIYPVTDPQSRTGTVRLVLKNLKGEFKTGALMDVTFDAEKYSHLSVPEDAVLYGADGAYVIEDIGKGYFQSIMVQTGLRAQGFTEIKAGLAEGQNIVTSGQFLIDAESNLRGGMKQMEGHNHE